MDTHAVHGLIALVRHYQVNVEPRGGQSAGLLLENPWVERRVRGG